MEIERGGIVRLEKAVQRLKNSGKRQKVLIVPSHNIKAAREAMQKVGVSGTVRNISDTHRSYVAANSSTRSNLSCNIPL